MQQLDPLVTLVILLAAALVGGMIAHRLRQPVILGYLLIGVGVGPHALGLVNDLDLIESVATIGVALLMFTLGLETSIAQLREVGKVGLLGSITQIIATFAIGLTVGVTLFGWPLTQAILFGLIISLSSTAVCLKILMERGELSAVQGRIMIAILIFQDISVVVMMVILPLLSGVADNLPFALAMSIGKAVLFVGIAIVSGRWILPWLMGRIGGVRTRELFLLTILVLCLGAAVGTHIFGLSIVFGAFLVGLVLRETSFVHQALAEITPLRDIFATLFFVSLGMLLNPTFLVNNLAAVALIVVIITFTKLVVVFGVVRLFGYSNRIAFLTGIGLFQIGEFSFILAQGGINMGIISDHFYSLILASAIITMLLTPVFVSITSRAYTKLIWMAGRRRLMTKKMATSPASTQSEASSRVVIAGYGRVGQNIAQGLQDARIPYLVIDIDPERIAEARNSKKPRIYGDASNPHVLSQADLRNAKTLVVTLPDPTALIDMVRAALEINPKLNIIARVHRAKEAELLKSMGVTELISPEYEASLEFMRKILAASGWRKADIKQALPIVQQDQEFVQFTTEDEP
ncbi:cation:proton antiporter [Chloroflexota bacterium]